MPFSLYFEKRHEYAGSEAGIEVNVGLTLGDRRVDTLAKVDTGAAVCIFQRQHGEDLGIEIEAGLEKTISTVGSDFLTYGHALTLEVLGYAFDAMVFFTKDEDFPRNVLGRRGWLDVVRLALIDYDRALYLSVYDE